MQSSKFASSIMGIMKEELETEIWPLYFWYPFLGHAGRKMGKEVGERRGLRGIRMKDLLDVEILSLYFTIFRV